jgi:hypothetical protein
VTGYRVFKICPLYFRQTKVAGVAEEVLTMGEGERAMRIVKNPSDVDNPILAYVLSYWRHKSSPGRPPSRKDIELRDLKSHLPWVILVDSVDGGEDFRYRVVGTRVAEYFLGDGTGKTVREALGDDETKELRDFTLWLFRETCRTRAPIRFTGPGGHVRGVFFPDYDAIQVPLAGDDATPDTVLSIFTFNYREFLESRSAYSLVRAS